MPEKLQESEREEFLSEREYGVCPLKDDNGRRVFNEKTGEQIFVSRKMIINPTEIADCVDLDATPDFREADQTMVSQPNILYRKALDREIEHDENPYDQARRIKREQQYKPTYIPQRAPRRSYLD